LQREFEKRVDPNDKNAQALLEEMRQHVKKLEDMRKNEDPRLSFSTPEFKEAQRIFTDGFKVSSHQIHSQSLTIPPYQLLTSSQPPLLSLPLHFHTPTQLQKNFGKPVDWALVKDHPWSTPQLRKLDQPVDVQGKPWPLDAAGNPIVK
jgi:hypothetical protein